MSEFTNNLALLAETGRLHLFEEALNDQLELVRHELESAEGLRIQLCQGTIAGFRSVLDIPEELLSADKDDDNQDDQST